MRYDPAKHHRRSIRLEGYDYHNAGAYFVTLCTQNRVCVLDDPVVKGIITDVWQALPGWFPTIALDEFVVMPNHVHFVVWLADTALESVRDSQEIVGTTLAVVREPWTGASIWTGVSTRTGANTWTGASPVPTGWVIPEPERENASPALGDVVGTFKSLVFKVYLDWVETHDPARRAKFWQHNYFEHIIRNDRELNAIAQYIRDNPINWELDRDNLQNSRHLPPPEKVEEYLQDPQELNRITP